MELSQVLYDRRSIRSFRNDPVPKCLVEQVLQAGVKAPSSKNRQPWRFVVVQEAEEKQRMLRAMREGIKRENGAEALLPGSRKHLAGAAYTAEIMEKAPVSIFILNPLANGIPCPATAEAYFYEMANLQSVGAAIENMLLSAQDLGLGGLWICDIYFAYPELEQWLNTKEQIVAAVTLGFPAEAPAARPRRPLEQIVEWR